MEASSIILHLAGLALLMGFSAFFSGSETSFSALSRTQIQRLREDRRKTSLYVIRFVDNPRRFFITVLFGNMLVNVAFVTITGSLIYQELFHGNHVVIASILAVVIELVLLLVLGEVTPKTLAMRHAESLATAAAAPLWFFSLAIFPFRRLLQLFTDLLLRPFGIHPHTERQGFTEDEFRHLVRSAEEKGVLDDHEAEVIGNIFDICNVDAHDLMIPRTDMICVSTATTIGEAFARARETRFSRLPVYRDTPDSISAIFHVKDLVKWTTRPPEELGDVDIKNLTIDEFLSRREALCVLNPQGRNTLIRPPFFAYARRRTGTLMREMTRERQRMAILVDEYGVTSGLVTVEDIIEDVLGEVAHDPALLGLPVAERSPAEGGAWKVPGLMRVRELNRRLRLRLDESRAETLSGYVTELIGDIPQSGATVIDEENHLKFEVLSMDGTRIEWVRVARTPSPPGEPASTPGLLLLALLPVLLAASAGSGAPPAAPLLLFGFASLLLLSLVFIGVYAGSETAVVSANKNRIEALAARGDRHAGIVRQLWSEPDAFLAMVLVGTNLMTVIAGQAALVLITYVFPGQESIHTLVNTVLMTGVILVFCEIFPKTLFYARADAMALRFAPLLRLSHIAFRPIVRLITRAIRTMSGASTDESRQESERITREELRLLAWMGVAEGALLPDALRMIQNVLSAETRNIGKVMVPLINVVSLPREAPTAHFLDAVATTGFTRIAVHEGRIDNIVGYVNIFDILYADRPDDDPSAFIRQDAAYEPETRQALSLLNQLKQSKSPMAFVVDEYGGVVGLITTEDLVEEIMGEIRDEKDIAESEYIHRTGPDLFVCEGRAEVVELNHRYNLEIPEGDYRTLGGYLALLLQRIPRQGDTAEAGRLSFAVLEADARRVHRVSIRRRPE